MRVLVSGATSMIGVVLCKELLNKGHEVFAVIREQCSKEEELPNSDKLHIIRCDMDAYDRLDQIVDGQVDVAILLAWNGTRGESRNNTDLQFTNLNNNMSALAALQKLGCWKVISAGSQAEYGPWYEQAKQSEECIPKPNTEYGKYKLQFYKKAKEYCEQNKMILVEPRFFSLYGPDDYSGTLVMSNLYNMSHNLPCQLTECKQTWDFLFITDAISGLMLLIEKDCQAGVYNFGYGQSAPLRYYIEKMYEILQSASELQYGIVPYPTTGMVSINPSVEKLKSLGWKPLVTFEEGICEIIKYRTDLIEGGQK